MTSNRRLASIGLAIAIVVLAVPLLAHAYAGTFSRYMGDDYCAGSTFRREGLIGGQKYFYVTWGAVPTTIALMAAVDPLGPGFARWLPGIALAAWAAMLYRALASFTPICVPGAPRLAAIAGAELLMFATTADTPNVVQSVYLRIPMLAYLGPVIAMAAYAGFLARAWRRGLPASPRAVAASALIAFVAANFGPVYAAMQTTLLMLAAVAIRLAVQAERRATLSPLVNAGVAASVAALAFIAVAPGNFKRAEFFPVRPSLPSVAWSAALYTMFMLARPALPLLRPAIIPLVPMLLPGTHAWLDKALAMASPPVLPFIVTLAGVLAGLSVPSRVRETVGRPLVLLVLPLAAVLAVAAVMSVGAYGTSAPPPPRALVMPQFVIECLLLAWGMAAGAMLAQRARPEGVPAGALLALAGFLTAAMVVEAARSTRDTVALVPVLRSWAQRWDAGDAELRRAPIGSPAATSALEPVGGVGSISTNRGDWVNVCAAQYYQLESVTGR